MTYDERAIRTIASILDNTDLSTAGKCVAIRAEIEALQANKARLQLNKAVKAAIANDAIGNAARYNG